MSELSLSSPNELLSITLVSRVAVSALEVSSAAGSAAAAAMPAAPSAGTSSLGAGPGFADPLPDTRALAVLPLGTSK